MNPGGHPRIFVSAGEPSGDAHAAGVVAALRRRWPDAVIDAFGGPALAAAGATVRFPMEEYTVIGFFEVLAKLPAHVRLLNAMRREFRAHRDSAKGLRQGPHNLRPGCAIPINENDQRR